VKTRDVTTSGSNSRSTKILYVTGRGGSLDKGLAVYLASIANEFEGVAVDVPFLRQAPMDQVTAIQQKLMADPARIVIANSYGAYLTLQALVDLDNPPQQMLLLAPVLGMVSAKDRMYISRPPFTKRLRSAFDENRVARPSSILIVVGDQDPLFNHDQFDEINAYFGGRALSVFPGEGHSLSRDIIRTLVSSLTQ